MMCGFISYINFSKSYGYITGYDGEEYYFEFISLDFPVLILKEQMEVKFSPNQNSSMFYATAIKKSS